MIQKHTIAMKSKAHLQIKEQHNNLVIAKQIESGTHKVQAHVKFKVLTVVQYKIQMVQTQTQQMNAYVSMVIIGTPLVQHVFRIHQEVQQLLLVWLAELVEQQLLLSLQLL